ncbi:retinoic acid receptor responder protein 2 isoform X1 [Bombina bombina]|uniref:retinoic acid receptor responder protein 2 isoform X1 n=1 Tax=Bombina bombina TaxID=8345 RepID=UPI00235B2B40|nr:retinoic acid receptor responder protein 2 isoform X1 [Bombina bombina]
MKTVTISLWLIPMAFVLSVGSQRLTDLQKRALTSAVEDFHRKVNINNAYKPSPILKVQEMDLSDGKFVQLQFHMKQTGCKKQDRNKKNCRILRSGSAENCFACYVFQNGSNRDWIKQREYIDCLPEASLTLDQEGVRTQACKNLQEEKIHLIGVYSFQRSD